MEDFKELRQDVKEIRQDLGFIKETLSANTVSLQAHMYRTELNEKRIQHLEYWLLGFMAALIIAFVKFTF